MWQQANNVSLSDIHTQSQRRFQMEFRGGAKVVTADGEQIGKVDRIVLDPRTREVTDLVVHKGLLFTEDKVLPVDLVAEATEEQVKLKEHATDLEELRRFEERHYVIPDRSETSGNRLAGNHPSLMYWYPPYYSTPYGMPTGYTAPFIQPYGVEIDRNIPKGTIPLREGAQVISKDDEHVGDVDDVLTDPDTERVTHFVISRGLLLHERKLIPVNWVDKIGENRVHLAVGSKTIQGLPDYEEEEKK
jgi:uncharacterized protein YrrD